WIKSFIPSSTFPSLLRSRALFKRASSKGSAAGVSIDAANARFSIPFFLNAPALGARNARPFPQPRALRHMAQDRGGFEAGPEKVLARMTTGGPRPPARPGESKI